MTQALLHHMCDGNVVVYKRPGSKTSNWYVRIKILKSGKWKKFTAKTDNLEEAKKFAEVQYGVIRTLEGRNDYYDGKKFGQVADLTIVELEEDLRAGTGKPTYNDYIRVIRLYKEQFGGKHIQNIKYQDLVEYHRKRTSQLGRKQKRCTINLHNTALKRVYDTAVQRGWMSKAQIVVYKNDGTKTERRSYFEDEECEKLRKFMTTYSTTYFNQGGGGNKKRSRWIRELLPDLVHFLVSTGIRFGTESKNIKWKHITEVETDSGYSIRIDIEKGKTNERTVIAHDVIRNTLESIKNRFPDLKDRTLGKMHDVDAFVFRLPDGTQPHDWHGAFKALLKRANLLTDKKGRNRSLYSLRHTYATYMLEKLQMDLHTLAQNMGTSVAMLERHYSHLNVLKRASSLASGEVGAEKEKDSSNEKTRVYETPPHQRPYPMPSTSDLDLRSLRNTNG